MVVWVCSVIFAVAEIMKKTSKLAFYCFIAINRHYNELVLNFVNLCYTDLLSYDRRLTHDQFSRYQG